MSRDKTLDLLRDVIHHTLREAKTPHLGAAVITYDDSDVIGQGIKAVTGFKFSAKAIPSGHASCAIISPVSSSRGSVIGINFSLPVCQKPKGVVDWILSKSPLPILTSLTVHVKRLGICKLSRGKLTEASSKQVAQMLKRKLHKGRTVSYVGINDVDAQKSLAFAGSNGQCKAYSIIPIGLPFQGSWEADLDNCASFVVDVISAGKSTLAPIGIAQLIATPQAVIPLAGQAFDAEFYGDV